MIVLFRADRDTAEELEVCKKYFNTSPLRCKFEDQLTIGRYSVLPYYQELEADLRWNGNTLINSYDEHKYIADFQYYFDIEEFTPQTYFGDWQNLPEGKYVVKGATNSRKFEWKTKMFAETKRDAIRIGLDLMNDLMIGSQGIIIRKYVELKNVGYSVNGIPFANEHRLFFLGDQLLSHGYYWSIADEVGQINQQGLDFAQKIANIVGQYVSFYVIDIAETANGDWIVIELNDGQMSGLSNNDPEILYRNLQQALVDWE